MLSIARGYSVKYLTEQVAAGRENYYTGAVAEGEPPGRWYGAGAAALGLVGLVDTQDMSALYEHFLDPRDEHFRDPSKWAQAATLGHTGRAYKSEQQLYDEALNAEPDASPERRAQWCLNAGKRTQQNVAFLDATFSVQKSVTVLHAAFEAQEVKARHAADDESLPADARADAEREAQAWGAHRQAVEDAIWAGNRASLDYLADKAGYSRIGHHGGAAGRWIDAHDWTVASFFQHDNRNHDPQLHIHNAILNRVAGADGKWRTLDSRAIHRFRGAAGAVGERATEEHLARSLGMWFATRPDGKAREIVGIAQSVLDLFSTRRRAVTGMTKTLAADFETTFGRAPNALELDRLQRQATLATRQAKSHDGETSEQRLRRWDRQLRAQVAGGLATVARQALAAAQHRPAAQAWSPDAVIATALAAVQTKKAAWTESDLARELNNALPDYLGGLEGPQVARLTDGLKDEALARAVPLDAERPGTGAEPAELRLANGRSVYQAPGGRLYATAEHVRSERALAHAATTGDAPALDRRAARGFVADLAQVGIRLGADQAAAVTGVLTSGSALESLVGPAGTGKSFVVGALAKAWQDPALWQGQHRRVVGLAASQIATEVLAGEGLAAQNTARWLATQRRLTEARPVEGDSEWRLHAGDLVVVDESSMANTADLAAIHHHTERAGAKLLLTGDHRQLAAAGAAGGMALVADAGTAYELTEARRFHQEWERAASLRLRVADQSVLGDYHKHGRLIDAGTLDQAEQSAASAWLGDTLAGKRSVLVVGTNEQADRISAGIRAELVRLGRVTEAGVPLDRQGTVAGVGDLVQARLNGWNLAGYEGNQQVPINRRQYRVVDTREDGGLVVAPVTGDDTSAGPGPSGAEPTSGAQSGEQITLPAAYVRAHLTLGYASTAHAVEGLTVDTSHAVITPGTSGPGVYVPLTRGRERNTAHVVTSTVTEAVTVGPEGDVDVVDDRNEDAVHRSPVAVLDGILETSEVEQSALATAAESGQQAGSVRTAAELLADASELAGAHRTAQLLDEMVDAGHMTGWDRARIAAEDGGPTLTRLLRRTEMAGHDPRQVLTDAVAGRSFDDARQVTHVLYHRVTTAVPLDPRGTTFADWTPQVDDPAWQSYLDTLAKAADARREELGEQVAAEQPPWVVAAFGPVPADPKARDEWVDKAATVAAHRELVGHDDPTDALGPAPKPGQVEAHAAWRAAWDTLGRPRIDVPEEELSDGLLHMRVRAYQRELAWAPRYVANELAGTRQAAEQQRHTATMRAAEAAAATDPAEHDRLTREASDAAALATVLEQRVTELVAVDNDRAEFLAHTAATRAAAERAKQELSNRHADPNRAADRLVTAEEWLAEHDAATRAADADRPITDEADFADTANPATQGVTTAQEWADLHQAAQLADDAERAVTDETEFADVADERAADLETAVSDDTAARDAGSGEPGPVDALPGPDVEDGRSDDADRAVTDESELADITEQRAADVEATLSAPYADPVDTGLPDLRDVAAAEPAAEHEDVVRVPTAAETTDGIGKAQRALAELQARAVLDEWHAADEARAEQLARWHADDVAAQFEMAAEFGIHDYQPALELAGSSA